MSDFGYKVTMTNEDCGVKQFIAFHDDRFLDWWQAGKQAYKHFPSQTCPRCNTNHKMKSYAATDIERGEADIYGHYSWRSIYPSSHREVQPELFA